MVGHCKSLQIINSDISYTVCILFQVIEIIYVWNQTGPFIFYQSTTTDNMQFFDHLWPVLLVWINLNPSMDKQTHAQ